VNVLPDESDAATTTRKLEEISYAARLETDRIIEHNAKVEAELAEVAKRQEAELGAYEAGYRKQMEAEKEQAARAAEEQEGEKEPSAVNPWPTERNKPRTLSFRGEEDTGISAPAPKQPPTPMVPPPPPMQPLAVPPVPAAHTERTGPKTMSFGAMEDDDEPSPVTSSRAMPERTQSRPARPRVEDEADEDLSERSWLKRKGR